VRNPPAASTTNTARIANSILTTNISDLQTNFVPIMFITTTATMSPMPIALPDHSGVCHGNSARR
jgi:hypothetical protein